MIEDLKEFLDEKAARYNHPSFIEDDPVQIPHLFSAKEDIEIAGFLAATIAWGNRKSVLASAHKMMAHMGNSPYDFVRSFTESDLDRLDGFVHRTFNAGDLRTFMRGLRHLYENHGGMEAIFSAHAPSGHLHDAIHDFKKRFFEVAHERRTQKHIADPLKNSAAKRVHLFLRWMVRQDQAGVDLGLWKSVPMHVLSCPLDVHSGRVGRALGLIHHRQDNRKALEELDAALRAFDATDPARYDYALFGLGLEGFAKI